MAKSTASASAAANLNKQLQKSKVLYDQARFHIDNVCVGCFCVVTLAEDTPWRNQHGRIVCEECRNPPSPEVLADRQAAAATAAKKPPLRVTIQIKSEPDYPGLGLGSFV